MSNAQPVPPPALAEVCRELSRLKSGKPRAGKVVLTWNVGPDGKSGTLVLLKLDGTTKDWMLREA